ncbi:beta-ketoacyl-ACP synthase III [Paraburkholderia sp. BR14263]|uniref:beta-ketoacyl-ACP synthase III n=1 Tax=unclassified Paraburkholderia TaxID=2615204 RepID=UPI0034CDC0E0
MRSSVIAGCGAALPERRVSNAKLAETLDTSDDWIYQRSGIRERRVADQEEKTSDLAIAAAQSALRRAGMVASDIDLVIVATATPDQTVPATAAFVHARLGMNHGAAFDVQAGCSGFIYALSIADSMIKIGQVKTALVIGAETLSRILDWSDRSSCVLFGDGAGAVILRTADSQELHEARGILSTHLHSDGRHHDKIFTDGGPSSTGTTGRVHLNGREVFLHAVTNLATVAEEALVANGLTCADIDWLIPHQANQRIIETLAMKIRLPLEKVIMTIDHHANTSAASIPLAMEEALTSGSIRDGDLVLMAAMGAGFTWGSALVRW